VVGMFSAGISKASDPLSDRLAELELIFGRPTSEFSRLSPESTGNHRRFTSLKAQCFNHVARIAW
jgi:hypothetical protein